ncbi:hypothetical protein PRK78_004569 [Emydomyces testavorans]|uniref:Uncharacterized protein n=1 Tax=Emydomyces testavorans TaxID=2070801 RepID=A0AAF0DI92_9EURO|nr:hypothetical protein PRK78_004569 [Emydomyces testavorans]
MLQKEADSDPLCCQMQETPMRRCCHPPASTSLLPTLMSPGLPRGQTPMSPIALRERTPMGSWPPEDETPTMTLTSRLCRGMLGLSIHAQTPRIAAPAARPVGTDHPFHYTNRVRPTPQTANPVPARSYTLK